MDHKELKRLLDRYKEGVATDKELENLHAWFEKTSMAGQWDWNARKKREINASLKRKIDEALMLEQPHITSFPWLKVAASVLLVISLTIYGIGQFKSGKHAYTEYASGNKMQKLLLKDSSMVYLRANSKIRIPKDFSVSSREIYLIGGEAYFDVHHDESKPFTVHSGQVNTRVLGTAFNVRFDKSVDDIEVTVLRGKVAVSESETGQKAITYLTPNQQVSVNTKTLKFRQRSVVSKNTVGWLAETIRFSNERLINVARLIEDRYKVEITFDDESIEHIRFTATFNESDSLEDVLNDICRVNNLNYELNDNQVNFKLRE